MFNEELPSAGFNGVADDLGLIDWDRYMDLPSGPDMSTWQDSTTEGISAQSEQMYTQLFVATRQDNVGFTPQEFHAENAHETSSHSSTNLATASAALIPNITPIDTPSTCLPEKTRTTYRCYECHIRKKPCDGRPGVRCSTCEKTCKKKSKRPSVKSIMHNGTPIPQFFRTQIDKTYDLLNKLRQHVNSEHPPKAVPMINDLFRGKWSLLCHLDDECGHFSRMKYSKSAKTIVVRPAIGVPPSARHSSSNSPPFLDYQEMSQFAFERAPENLIQQLPDVDQEVATDAWKCAFFINALYNWNRHQLFVDRLTTLTSLGHDHPAVYQVLFLEFMYTLSYHVAELLHRLLKKVVECSGTVELAESNPLSVSYALCIVADAIKRCRRPKESVIKHPKREEKHTAGDYLHYRWDTAAQRCGTVDDIQHRRLFDQIFDNAKSLRVVMSVSFEWQPEYPAGSNQPTIDGYLFSDAFHFKPLEGAGDILYALIHPESHKTDGESISAKAVQSLDPPHSGKSSRACYGKVSLASSTMTLVDGKTKGTDEAVEQPVRKRMASSTDELSGRSTKL
ncbi:hypothetical protein K456DRAFT_42141 [Colletotrichum gloeosporioides 23]|nr:hypothetical protein K456DRAFT_42141 [Colletotrichum gloeosporioides 23]